MGRVSTICDARIFAAVGRQLSEDGAMTLHNVVAETGVSVGSIYHRYHSREGLLALAWLDAVQTFQHQFLTALESGEDNAGECAALATPQFCRAEPLRAVILACCRQSEFASDATHTVHQAKIRSVNNKLKTAIRQYAQRTGYSLDACRLGLIAFPLGAVRLYLPKRSVPRSLDTYIAEAFQSAIHNKKH